MSGTVKKTALILTALIIIAALALTVRYLYDNRDTSRQDPATGEVSMLEPDGSEDGGNAPEINQDDDGFGTEVPM